MSGHEDMTEKSDHQCAAPMFERFSEGLGVADPRDARAMLDAL
jgi:hypothetical protein